MQGISWFLIKSWYYWNTSSLKPKLTSQKKTVILAWLFQSPNNYWDSTVPSYKTLNFIQMSFTIHYFHKDHNTPWFLPHPYPPSSHPPPPHQFSKPVSPVSPGYYSHPKRNRTQWLLHFFWPGGGGGKQGASCSMQKWWIVFSFRRKGPLQESLDIPLGPKSDQHQFSPNNINALSREKGVRIN